MHYTGMQTLDHPIIHTFDPTPPFRPDPPLKSESFVDGGAAPIARNLTIFCSTPLTIRIQTVLGSGRITGLMERETIAGMLTEIGSKQPGAALDITPAHLPDKKIVNYRAMLTELRKGVLRRTNTDSLVVTGRKNTRFAGHATIRTDVAKKALKSVMEFRNLGDEGGVDTIMNPSPATQRNIEDDAFTKGRDKQFIEKLFTSAGIRGISFESVWGQAQAADGTVSIQAFQASLEAIAA